MIVIGVLVAISALPVYRRDGIDGVTAILTNDLALFGGILPRLLAGCLLGAFVAEILPRDKVSQSLGPQSGLKGLLIGTAFGVILPGGPFTAYPVASALLSVGADFGATIGDRKAIDEPLGFDGLRLCYIITFWNGFSFPAPRPRA